MFQPKQIDQKEYVQVVPEDGLQAAHISLLVDLGKHKQLPRYAKNTQGDVELNDDGTKKIIWPKEGDKGLVQKVSVYADLLDQTHDYGADIGVKNIREPMHQVSYNMSDGVNYITVAPRDQNNNYIKGRPWTLASASLWNKIATVTKTEQGAWVKDVIFAASYDNPNLNNVGLLLGRPFMVNVEVKSTTKEGKTYHNVKLKSPVPLMKGLTPAQALIAPVSISINDTDLLEKKESLGGASKFDMLRKADLHRIVLAENYVGSEMQKAIREKMNEGELISKAKELFAKKIAADKELQEILASSGVQSSAPAVNQEKPAQNSANNTPAPSSAHDPDLDDQDLPF